MYSFANFTDLDREEVFIGGLPEFPSLDNGMGTNGDDDDDLSIGLPTPPPPPRQPVKSKHTPPPSDGDPTDKALEFVNQMAGDFIAAAVTAAIQERIEAALSAVAVGAEDMERPSLAPQPATLLPLDLAEESDSEVEDFELLDQSELEQLEGELGLGEEKTKKAKEEDKEVARAKSSGGFFSKLLGRRH